MSPAPTSKSFWKIRRYVWPQLGLVLWPLIEAVLEKRAALERERAFLCQSHPLPLACFFKKDRGSRVEVLRGVL